MNDVLKYNHLTGVEGVVASLEQLLADFQVYYTNLRGFHWNVQGPSFFQAHEAFEKMYDAVAENIDELAERVLQLGGTPTARFSDYLKVAKVAEAGVVHCPTACWKNIAETLAHLLDAERAIVEAAGEIGDEATVALLGDFISGQEKELWFIAATLTEPQPCECKK